MRKRPLSLNSLVRMAAGISNITYDRTPIVSVRGGQEPAFEGESGHFTTPSGKTRIRHPGAYRWAKVYHRSTYRVEVGSAWLSGLKALVCAYDAAVKSMVADITIRA